MNKTSQDDMQNPWEEENEETGCEECDDCECHCKSECKQESEEKSTEQAESKENEYLDMARRVQADFENYRRHAEEDIKNARLSGQASVIEVFLPCLDNFKEAKKLITDTGVLEGVEMIEEKINHALESLGVERIESIGKIYDPSVHNVIAVMKNEEEENDIILDEYQAGYKFGGKVIRYAKVIVNKKEEK